MPLSRLPGKILSAALLLGIRFYQCCISPLLPRSCIHQPSCSAYAIDAIKAHGAILGFIMSVMRISRCHPFAYSENDPVPKKLSWQYFKRNPFTGKPL